MQILNGVTFKNMLVSASNNLVNNKSKIDAMNVFPVPDGDTGTNMSMTFSNGVLEANKVTSLSINDIAKGLSYGLLMGARGNSGVITSQIFRGFYLACDGKETLDVTDLAHCFKKGSEIAYKAVMKPVEGTILSVIRLASDAAFEYVKNNKNTSIEAYMKALFDEAKSTLDLTPEMMPLLKEVGVVDSGGYGLVTIFEGMLSALNGNIFQLNSDEDEVVSVQNQIETEEFGYCTEFILKLNETGKFIFDEDNLKRALLRIGNSLVVVCDDDLVKVHVHTLIPGEVLNIASRFGDFIKLKIENMTIQHENLIVEKKIAEQKDYAIITVCSGEGLCNYFKELRVDKIVSGGQTMNPSTDDFVKAISELNAKHYYILPNNSNIIMAAKQAIDVLTGLDITVFETRSIQEGIAACLNFNPEADNETNVVLMNEAIENMVSGSITYATKDTEINGVKIKNGDFIAMSKKSIIASDKKLDLVTIALVDNMYFEDAELFTIYTGLDADEKITNRLVSYIDKKYNLETEVIKGDQPVYCYLLGIE